MRLSEGDREVISTLALCVAPVLPEFGGLSVNPTSGSLARRQSLQCLTASEHSCGVLWNTGPSTPFVRRSLDTVLFEIHSLP